MPYTSLAHQTTLRGAMHIIQTRITTHAPCNTAFKALPGGRTLQQIWADPNIWINFDPANNAGDYAATRGNDVTITAFALNKGRWTVAATLVHELAHVGGAPGGTSPLAEQALLPCLLGDLRQPGLVGQLIQARRMQRVA
ncbi:MAG TPA: hypothetical protein VFH68_00465 [Polyangia bacterium]|nr:hypothetical protein [Polyangia bacterium]